jgi:ketosteroid isomerase-like protein
MKRKGFLAVFLLAFSLLVLNGCQPATVDTNRSAPPTNSGRETVDTAAIETELMRIENDWPRVVKERDVAAVQRVEADDAIFVYPDGTTGGKDQDVKDMETGALSADSWEMADLKVNVLDSDSAVVSGRSIVKNGKYKMPDGKTIDISGQYRFVDTFHRRNGEWKLVAGVSTPIRAPIAASPSPGASPAAKASPAAVVSPAAKASPVKKASPSPSPTTTP